MKDLIDTARTHVRTRGYGTHGIDLHKLISDMADALEGAEARERAKDEALQYMALNLRLIAGYERITGDHEDCEVAREVLADPSVQAALAQQPADQPETASQQRERALRAQNPAADKPAQGERGEFSPEAAKEAVETYRHYQPLAHGMYDKGWNDAIREVAHLIGDKKDRVGRAGSTNNAFQACHWLWQEVCRMKRGDT